MCDKPSNHSFQLTALALAIAATSGIAAPALAQEIARATEVEEIVVTAQRREESLQDAPIAITAFTETKLRELGVYGINDIGYRAPNLTIANQVASKANMNVSIRGFSNSETQLIQEPKVGIYIDGVYISKTVGALFDVSDLERIEVLRGPQGTLFGRNTTGGAINVTTKKPSGELDAKLQASAGNLGYERWGGTVDLPGYHNFATKFSYYHMKNDGWADNNYDGPAQSPARSIEHDLGSEDNNAYRFALRWTPIEELTVDYLYDKTDNEGVPDAFQVTHVHTQLYNGFTSRPVPYQTLGGALYQQMAATIGDPDDAHRNLALDANSDSWLDIDGHSLIVAWDLGDVTLKYLYGKRSTDEGNHGNDLDGGAYLARDAFYGTLQGNNNPIPVPGVSSATVKSHLDMDSHEFQIVGDAMDAKLRYTGGLYYYKEDAAEIQPQTVSLPIESLLANPRLAPFRALYKAFGYCPPEAGGACIGTQRQPFAETALIPSITDPGEKGLIDAGWGGESKSWAAYGQASYAITERFDLTLGIRYTEDEKDQYLYSQNLAGTTPSAPATADDNWNQWTYMANGTYQFTEDVGVYLKYSTGYNSGGFNGRSSSVAAFQTPYSEEEVETWELGLKSQWFENRLRANAALFTNDFTDIQLQQFEAGAGGGSSRTVNAGKSTFRGFELDLVAIPVEGLTIDLTYGYLDADFDEYMQRNPGTNLLEDLSNQATVPYAPENTASMGVQYDFQPFSFGQLSMRLDAAYRDSMVFSAIPSSSPSEYFSAAEDRTLIDGRISLNDIPIGGCCKDGAHVLRVSLWGKNLSDEEYRTFGVDFGSLGFAGVSYGAPRSYGIDVLYTYN
jgi:iron complex outermembrane recepter protein